MARAALIPRFEPDGAPVSFLIDYDGTISLVDVADNLLRRFVTDPVLTAELADKDLAYAAGGIGSRELMRWDMEVLPRYPALLRETAAAAPHDPTFVDFVRAARARGAALEIVSDGLGFYLEPALAALGLGDLPVATNDNDLGAPPPALDFPYGHPRCQVCGTCKRERVRAHQAAGQTVVFVGDGVSDRFAAAHADVVFAKDQLAELCAQEGWPFRPWGTFSEIARWMTEAFDSGELAARQTPESRRDRPPDPHGFICGPEIWGPFRLTPGPSPSSTPRDSEAPHSAR
ncbi:MAG: HAD-IB family phosphatase [Chloroflexi bacterium]|nr:HAD-IB family phosphatase [Chloroflexota bacterium]